MKGNEMTDVIDHAEIAGDHLRTAEIEGNQIPTRDLEAKLAIANALMSINKRLQGIEDALSTRA